jgi:hypothetical protein
MQAVEMFKMLQDYGVIHNLSDPTSLEFQDMAVYRLQPLQSPHVLNTFCLAQNTTEDSVDAGKLVKDLHFLLDDIYFSNDCPAEMKKDESYQLFQEHVSRLQKISLNDFVEANTRVSFGINLCNLMVRHGLVELEKACWRDSLSFSCNVGGEDLTLHDISHRLFYGHNCTTQAWWKRLIVRCIGGRSQEQPSPIDDPRIHFCLSFGTRSSPDIRIFNSYHLEQQLRQAAQEYCQERITLDETHGVISLPAVFRQDFGDELQLKEFLVHYLSRDQLLVLERIHHKFGSKNVQFKYEKYDWNRNYQMIRPFKSMSSSSSPSKAGLDSVAYSSGSKSLCCLHSPDKAAGTMQPAPAPRRSISFSSPCVTPVTSDERSTPPTDEFTSVCLPAKNGSVCRSPR